jgi:hypothetical protein
MMDEWMQKRMDFSKQYQALQKANQEKARNEAEYLIKHHKLDQVNDMVLECLIDDLMMERDCRTYGENE